jgi:hypothetical protein
MEPGHMSGAMTANEYRRAIDILGMTQSRAGLWLGVTTNTGRVWAAKGCPPTAAKLLRLAYLQELGMTPYKIDGFIETETAALARYPAREGKPWLPSKKVRDRSLGL